MAIDFIQVHGLGITYLKIERYKSHIIVKVGEGEKVVETWILEKDFKHIIQALGVK